MKTSAAINHNNTSRNQILKQSFSWLDTCDDAMYTLHDSLRFHDKLRACTLPTVMHTHGQAHDPTLISNVVSGAVKGLDVPCFGARVASILVATSARLGTPCACIIEGQRHS